MLLKWHYTNVSPKNFSSPSGFQLCKQFHQASALSDKSLENQENMLIYTMGYVADDILSSFGLSEEDKRNYDMVVHKLEGHFVKKTIIFEHA